MVLAPSSFGHSHIRLRASNAASSAEGWATLTAALKSSIHESKSVAERKSSVGNAQAVLSAILAVNYFFSLMAFYPEGMMTADGNIQLWLANKWALQELMCSFTLNRNVAMEMVCMEDSA